jgi:hypothetical protein
LVPGTRRGVGRMLDQEEAAAKLIRRLECGTPENGPAADIGQARVADWKQVRARPDPAPASLNPAAARSAGRAGSPAPRIPRSRS